MNTNVRELLKKSRSLYPNNRALQHQWVRATKVLVESDKHVLYGAPVKWGNC